MFTNSLQPIYLNISCHCSHLPRIFHSHIANFVYDGKTRINVSWENTNHRIVGSTQPLFMIKDQVHE